jgi:hypothetical protein
LADDLRDLALVLSAVTLTLESRIRVCDLGLYGIRLGEVQHLPFNVGMRDPTSQRLPRDPADQELFGFLGCGEPLHDLDGISARPWTWYRLG